MQKWRKIEDICIGNEIKLTLFIISTLKIKDTLPAKISLFRNSRELQFGACKQWQNHGQIQYKRERNITEKEKVGRGCCSDSPKEKCSGWKVVSHWVAGVVDFL